MEKDVAKKLGMAMRRAREASGLTQTEAAERIGISLEFYARMERAGTLPSVPTLVRIADSLNISPDVIIARSPKASRPLPKPNPVQPAEPRELRHLLRRLRTAKPATLRLLNRIVVAIEGHRKLSVSTRARPR